MSSIDRPARLLLATIFFCAAGCGEVELPQAATDVAESVATPPVGAWPAWRGGACLGVSPSQGALLQWTAADVGWRVRVAGQGNSSPVVWDNQIFLTADVDGDLQVMSYDRDSGQRQWAISVAAASGPTHGRNGYASATPATDGRVVVAALGGALHAVSVEGRPLWSAPLSDGHRWGAASSPVLCGNLAVHLNDNEGGGSELVAFHLATGEPRWRTPRTSDGNWTSPVVACDSSGRPQMVVVNGSSSSQGKPGRVTAYSLQDGKPLWSVAGTADIPCPTALLTEELVISSSGSNGPLLAIARDTGEVAWRQPAGGSQLPTGVCFDGLLFLLSDHGALACLDAESGASIWRHRLPGKFSASLIAANGHLYATSESGDVHVVPARREFSPGFRSSLRESCVATPAVAGDDLVFRTESHLWLVGPSPAGDLPASPSQMDPRQLQAPRVFHGLATPDDARRDAPDAAQDDAAQDDAAQDDAAQDDAAQDDDGRDDDGRESPR